MRQLIEFSYELFAITLVLVFLVTGRYLEICVVVLMYSASQVLEELAWQRIIKRVDRDLERGTPMGKQILARKP